MFRTESMGAHFILVSFHPVRLLIFAWMRDTPFSSGHPHIVTVGLQSAMR
jgi:hypothetical protein